MPHEKCKSGIIQSIGRVDVNFVCGLVKSDESFNAFDIAR